MSLRKDFVALALEESSNVSAVCRQFGISRKTGYKWISRYRLSGGSDLAEGERRPHRSPQRTPAGMEALVLSVREMNPCWGGRKIRAWLGHHGHTSLPSASTITEILRRHGTITAEASQQHRAFIRFEHAAPNDLWQMDFKGNVSFVQDALGSRRCYPLTVLDDHSRYSVCLTACANEQRASLEPALRETFRRYGLPRRMTMDNGSPWGSDSAHPYTGLTVWLMRLGIGVSHSRPYHPQTQGKDERFHRTLKAELLQHFQGGSYEAYQRAFDTWRDRYNLERPHEAIGNQVPASRYRISERPYPEQLPPIEYEPGDLVRKVQQGGELHLLGHIALMGKAFIGYPIALRPTSADGVFDAYFCQYRIKEFDLHQLPKS